MQSTSPRSIYDKNSPILILLTHEGIHGEAYSDFQPNYDAENYYGFLKKVQNPQEEKSDLHEEKMNLQEEKMNLQEEKMNPQEEKTNQQLRNV